MTFRDHMIECRDNLSWCKPISFLDGKVIAAVNEGDICGLRIDGKDVDATPETIKMVAKLVNEDYDLYSGRSDAFIMLDADHEHLPCCDCPWFDVCDAMDNEC